MNERKKSKIYYPFKFSRQFFNKIYNIFILGPTRIRKELCTGGKFGKITSTGRANLNRIYSPDLL